MSVLKKSNDSATATNDSLENACVVCYKKVEIFSIGECDHPVCYECSTRMRVLCQQNECPICRQGLSKVIFTTEVRPYRELEVNNRSEYYNKKYKICFSNIQIQKCFYDLLDHPCPKCDCPSFNSFDALKDHVRREHEMFYCDICTENLKIFSFERKCYTRPELGMHRRKGDSDNKSHRGHPLCQYCEIRYLDRDELFRHLRRDHYYCHFCDADGTNEFYPDYICLRQHYRAKHYLCEEGDCAREQFTTAYRSEIDLKAHFASVHGKFLGKQQAKQARTLQLEITLGPRGRSIQQEQVYSNARQRGNNEHHEEEPYQPPPIPAYSQPKVIDAKNEQEFPSLGTGTTNTSAVTLIRPNMSILAKSASGLVRTKENFPALGGEGGGGFDREPNKQNSLKNNYPSVSALLKNNSQLQTRPRTGGSMVIHVSNRPTTAPNNAKASGKPYQDHFPALPGSTKSSVNLREDLVFSNSSINLKSVSAKHRSLVDDYVSVADPYAASKQSVASKEAAKLMKKASANLREDLVFPNSTINLKSVSAKHRSLVDDYVSVADPYSASKLSVASKEAAKPVKKPESSHSPPKLTSSNFPALAANATIPEVSWVKSQKHHDLENRKSKVAPAPVLNGFEILHKKGTEKKEYLKQSKSASDLENNNNKKDKKSGKGNDKKSNDNKKIDTGSVKSLNQSNKSIKEKKLDNNNESKVANKNRNNEKSLTTDNNCNNYDFPKLDSGSAPPPGFSNKSNGSKPPPGFQNVTLNSVAKPPNNLTFTSSLGESYSIVPSYQYIPPPNSAKRNQELVMHFQNTLKYQEAVEEFRHISQKFREGQYKAMPYYEHCEAALKDKFDDLFPELLSLLPDINKQQELFLVHSQRLKELESNKKNQKQKLEVCSTCKQVLKSTDVKSHIKSHSLENNFPSLKNANSIASKK